MDVSAFSCFLSPHISLETLTDRDVMKRKTGRVEICYKVPLMIIKKKKRISIFLATLTCVEQTLCTIWRGETASCQCRDFHGARGWLTSPLGTPHCVQYSRSFQMFQGKPKTSWHSKNEERISHSKPQCIIRGPAARSGNRFDTD